MGLNVTGETVTAALMNSAIRDNFLETSAATVTTAGDIAFADAANSMGSRFALGAANSHLVSTGSAPVWRVIATDVDSGTESNDTAVNGTGYFSLGVSQWGFATQIQVSLTTGTLALVLFKAKLLNDTAGDLTFLSYQVTGATTVAANDAHGVHYESGAALDQANFGGFDLRTGLTAGANTFFLAGRGNGGVASIGSPEIAVLGF